MRAVRDHRTTALWYKALAIDAPPLVQEESFAVLAIATYSVASLTSRPRFLPHGTLALVAAALLFTAGHGAILPFRLLGDLFREQSCRVIPDRFLGRQGLVRRAGRSLWKMLVVPPVDLAPRLPGRGITFGTVSV